MLVKQNFKEIRGFFKNPRILYGSCGKNAEGAFRILRPRAYTAHTICKSHGSACAICAMGLSVSTAPIARQKAIVSSEEQAEQYSARAPARLAADRRASPYAS